MGNELFKKYTIDKNPFTSTGFLSLWKVYNGYHKEKKQDVCVFFLDKKSLKSHHKSKSERREIISILKRDTANLSKYQNDYFLRIIDPLIEDKRSMGFITEPFQSTLTKWCEQTSPSKLEIKLMIKELCNGIASLHQKSQLLHCDINSNSILVTKDNKIRIAGVSFMQSEGAMMKYSSSIITPNLSYASPEVILDKQAKFQSDTYSIGVLIFTLLKKYLNDKNKTFLDRPKDINEYKAQMKHYDQCLTKVNFIEEDNELLIKILGKEADTRPTVEEMILLPWFNDPKLKSLYFLENLDNNDYDKNMTFIEKLPGYITHYENRVIERRILPLLLNALSKENLISVILPCIFTICDLPMIKVKFEEIVWPKIKELFLLKSLPASSLYTLMTKITFFNNKISDKEFELHFLNIICKALDSNVAKIQCAVVDNLNFLLSKFKHETFQSDLYPRLTKLLTSTPSNTTKGKILVHLKAIYSFLDHNTINESLLIALASIKITESNTEVCMGIANIYEEIAKIVSVESIANRIIPNLITLLVSGNITKGNFDRIMKLVLTYLDRIKVFREKDLCEEKTEGIMPNDTNNNSISVSGSKIITIDSGNKQKEEKNFLEDFFKSNNNDMELASMQRLIINKNSQGGMNNNDGNIKKTSSDNNIQMKKNGLKRDLSYDELHLSNEDENRNELQLDFTDEDQQWQSNTKHESIRGNNKEIASAQTLPNINHNEQDLFDFEKINTNHINTNNHPNDNSLSDSSKSGNEINDKTPKSHHSNPNLLGI